jgi:hypothetical protein
MTAMTSGADASIVMLELVRSAMGTSSRRAG